MADFLFEIGLEEVPARMIAGAQAELQQRVVKMLERERLVRVGCGDEELCDAAAAGGLGEGCCGAAGGCGRGVGGAFGEDGLQGWRGYAGGGGVCEEGWRGCCGSEDGDECQRASIWRRLR